MEGMELLGALEEIKAPTPPSPIFTFLSAALLFLGFELQRAPGAVTALSPQSCSSELDRDGAVPETRPPSCFLRPLRTEGGGTSQPLSLQIRPPST